MPADPAVRAVSVEERRETLATLQRYDLGEAVPVPAWHILDALALERRRVRVFEAALEEIAERIPNGAESWAIACAALRKAAGEA